MVLPQFYEWIIALLQTIKSNRIPPTIASRWFFLACSLAWDSYQYVTPDIFSIDINFLPNGKGKVLGSNMLICYFFEAIHQSWTTLFTTYMKVPTTFIDTLWASQSSSIYTYSQSSSVLSSWVIRANSYLIARDADGWKTSTTLPGPLINNGSSIISTGYSSPGVIQDLSTIPDIQKWTPLQTGGKVQNYLTPGWGNVSPLINIGSDVDNIGNSFFPSNIKHDREISDSLSISQSLTDQQKMITELWTGGGNTVTPPGMWMFFSAKLAESQKMDLLTQLKMFKYVSASLFQASISAWYLKWKYQQSRPIQNIRSTYKGQTATIWTGPVDLGAWVPYQDPSGYTPPHPDFVSGHSTFSSAASRVLDLFLQTPSVPTVQFSSSDLALIADIFPSNIGKSCVNLYSCYPGCSAHQPGVVPNAGVTLTYSSWDEMANSAGISRVYGGIHTESSNQGGLAVGRFIGDKIFENL
jgi:hypothetical protein